MATWLRLDKHSQLPLCLQVGRGSLATSFCQVAATLAQAAPCDRQQAAGPAELLVSGSFAGRKDGGRNETWQ